MTTANEIISRAGRRAKILAQEEAFDGAEAVDLLELLNGMMHGFGPKGIHYAHTTLAAADTVNMPDEQIDNLISLFTEKLCIEEGMPIDALLAAKVVDAKNELQAAYHSEEVAVTDPILRPRYYGRYDITRGE